MHVAFHHSSALCLLDNPLPYQMADLWQEPHVNLFKHYGIGQWKKCHKEGDVVSYMDRLIKVITVSISASTRPGQDLLLLFFFRVQPTASVVLFQQTILLLYQNIVVNQQD